MAYQYSSAQLIPDQNLGLVNITINHAASGALQIDGAIRLNRQKYEEGQGLLQCLSLEDRYLVGLSQDGSQTFQQGLGYPAANFLNPALINFV